MRIEVCAFEIPVALLWMTQWPTSPGIGDDFPQGPQIGNHDLHSILLTRVASQPLLRSTDASTLSFLYEYPLLPLCPEPSIEADALLLSQQHASAPSFFTLFYQELRTCGSYLVRL